MSSSKPFRTYQRRSKSKSSDSVDFIPTIPKAPRTRSSHSVPAGDSSPFVSPKATSFFDDVVSKKKFVPERSYQIDALPLAAQDSTTHIFEHYHLHSLNTLSGKFNASAIKEFYSNFPANPKGSNYQIVVRSVPITLRPSIINRVLGFRSCPGFDSKKFALASSQYTVDMFKTMAYTDQTMTLTSKGLPIKSYLSPFYKFLWDFIRHNILPIGNNSNPTLAGCQLMISMRLYERNKVVFHNSDQWNPPIAQYGKAFVALSQKVSKTFLTSVSSTSENASLISQLAPKEKHIQHLLSLIPSSSTPVAAVAEVDPQPAPTTKDSDASIDSDESA
ncbi:unnamed protein product, partial [Prunus brigantina]